MEANSGEVFYAFNKDMVPEPKNKYHLCINQNNYFIINTKPSRYCFEIDIPDCNILKHKCNINLIKFETYPIKNFNIIKKAQLSKSVLVQLIEKIKSSPTLTNMQINMIVSEFKKCL